MRASFSSFGPIVVRNCSTSHRLDAPRNIVAQEGWRNRRQNARKACAIGIGGVSSKGDTLGAEAVWWPIRARVGQGDMPGDHLQGTPIGTFRVTARILQDRGFLLLADAAVII